MEKINQWRPRVKKHETRLKKNAFQPGFLARKVGTVKKILNKISRKFA